MRYALTLVVIAGLGLVGGYLLLNPGFHTSPRVSIHLNDVSGLRVGSELNFRGFVVGRVAGIQLVDGMRFVVQIKPIREWRTDETTMVRLSQPNPFQPAVLEVLDHEEDCGNPSMVKDSSWVICDRRSNIIDKANQVADDLVELATQARGQLVRVEELFASLDRIRNADVSAVSDWMGQLEAVVGNAADSSGKLRRILDHVPDSAVLDMLERIDGTLQNAEKVVASIERAVNEAAVSTRGTTLVLGEVLVNLQRISNDLGALSEEASMSPGSLIRRTLGGGRSRSSSLGEDKD